jgi:excisionase family DNA binding protein
MKNQTERNRTKPPQRAQPSSNVTKLTDVGRLLSVSETASRLGVKPATIRAWILRREKLEIVKIGRCVRITERSVNTFINNNLVPPEK